MSENVGTIYYTVEAETQKLLDSVTPVDAGLDRLQKTFARTDKAANQASFQMTKTAVAVKSLGRESQTTASSLGMLAKLLGGYLSLQGANNLIQMAESYREMGERIRFATASQEEYEEVQRRLLTTANGTYRALSEAQEVYILTADSLRSMGYSTEQALDITDSLSYSFVKNAASAQRGANATRAYSNAIMKGRVEADGWMTIISAVPSIIEDIAAASGMSAEEVRKLGAEGKLTAQQLNEGLRQSLESNKAAADGMATTVRDAFNNMRNSLSAYLGESQSATSATGLLSNAILVLGNNIGAVVQALTVVGAGALAKYIASAGQAAIASGRGMLAARSQAAEELRLAQAHASSTAATLAHAQANAGLSAMSASAGRAADAHTAALARLAAAHRAVTATGVTLTGVLGGPVGMIALAAAAGAAFFTMGRNASETAPDIDKLTDAVNRLSKAQLELRQQQAGEFADNLRRGVIEASKSVRGLEKDVSELEERAQQGRGVDLLGVANARKSLVEARAELDDRRQQLDKVIAAEKQLADEQERRRGGGGGGASPAQESDPEVQKRLQAMRDEVALAKLTGVARARLQAIQRLGTKAGEKEVKEAERLAAELYELEEARKKLAQSTKNSIKETQENSRVVDDLAKSLYEAGLAGEALATAKALASLNEFATPQQITQVKDLARAVYLANEAMAARQKFGTGAKADEYIFGSAQPLSGGLFDSQYARYEAEAAEERKRYAAQLERLKEARELQIETQRSYNELEQQAAKDHALRMQQIEQAKNQLLLSSGQDLFSALADAAKTYAGESSGAYRAMFAASKAFAIAQATLNLSSAVSQAMADPTAVTPAQKFANMAAIASAGGQLVSAIAGASYGGGRQHGGPVSAGKFYRINETGAPEILNTNGRQYLMMNQSSGHVTPMGSGSGSGGASGPVQVSISIQSDGSSSVETNPATARLFGEEIGELIEARWRQMMTEEQQPGGLLWRGGV